MNKDLYVIVYRTGGTENFKWNVSLAMSKREAIKSKMDCEKMGYTCYMWLQKDVEIGGVPETYGPVNVSK